MEKLKAAIAESKKTLGEVHFAKLASVASKYKIEMDKAHAIANAVMKEWNTESGIFQGVTSPEESAVLAALLGVNAAKKYDEKQ